MMMMVRVYGKKGIVEKDINQYWYFPRVVVIRNRDKTPKSNMSPVTVKQWLLFLPPSVVYGEMCIELIEKQNGLQFLLQEMFWFMSSLIVHMDVCTIYIR